MGKSREKCACYCLLIEKKFAYKWQNSGLFMIDEVIIELAVVEGIQNQAVYHILYTANI